jgi:plastocyanin
MSRDVRSRVMLGAGIPLAAFLFLALLILAFSRILLAVPEELAPWVALLFATNILVGCALAATIPGRRGFTFLIGVIVATILIGGIAGLVIGPRPVESLVAEGEQGAGGEQPPGMPGGGGAKPGGGGKPAPGPAVSISAQDLAYSTSELSLPANAPSVVAFENKDAGVPHNFAIYTAPGGEPLFQGELLTGPGKTDYQIPPLQAGELHFQCDVHPATMNGTLTVG